MGLNTIETYVAWNAHEPRRGSGTRPGGTTSAWVSVDGTPIGTMSRTLHERSIMVPPGVPAPLLRSGENAIVVMELDHVTLLRAVFVARPRLGPTEE